MNIRYAILHDGRIIYDWFDEHADAVSWIANDGDLYEDYRIVKIYRLDESEEKEVL